MTVICPKCRHVRPPDARNPDWECPSCGICYAKYAAPAPPPQGRVVAPVATEGWKSGWLPWLLLATLLVWGLGAWIKRGKADDPAPQAAVVQQQEVRAEPDPGRAAADAVLEASGADASMLRALSGRLERGCARNKYGLSESDCVTRIRAREDLCAGRTAQRFPGRMSDTGRMQEVVQAHVACIFEG